MMRKRCISHIHPYPVGAQFKHVKTGQVFNVLNFGDLVLYKKELLQVSQVVEVLDF